MGMCHLRYWIACGAFLAALVPTCASAAEVEGVRLDDKAFISQGMPEVVLNGAGVRQKLLVAKVYVLGLYLTTRHKVDREAIADPGPKRLALHILQDEITAEEFVGALHNGLSANVSPPEMALLERRLRELAAMMREVGRINRGSTILLDYLPGIGTRITVNGVARLTISGDDFNRALLRIWLGDHPVDGRLKRALLGGSGGLLPF
jgi:hypothetical protein